MREFFSSSSCSCVVYTHSTNFANVNQSVSLSRSDLRQHFRLSVKSSFDLLVRLIQSLSIVSEHFGSRSQIMRKFV